MDSSVPVSPATESRASLGYGLLCAWLVLLLVLSVLARFSATSVMDDAFMFVRYAEQWLASGQLRFNPGDSPTYGLTSPAFLLVVAPIRMLVPGQPALVALLASLACAIAAAGMCVALVAKAAGRDAGTRRLAVAGFLFSLVVAEGSYTLHAVSGMDTSLAILWVAAYVRAAVWHGQRDDARGTLLLGLLGGIAWSIRPDLVLFAIGIPAAHMILGGSSRAARGAWRVLAITCVLTALQVAFYARGTGSPVPLPFFAKAMGLYGPEFEAQYRHVGREQLLKFVAHLPLVFGFAVAGVAVAPRTWWRRSTPTEKGVAAATLAYLGYYAFGVLQVMYYGERFFFPALPALAFLAARGFARLTRTLRPRPSANVLLAGLARGSAPRERWTPPGFLRDARTLTLLGTVMALAGLGRVAFSALREARHPEDAPRAFHLDVNEDYQRHWTHYWPLLDSVSGLPGPVVIATTEVGRVVAMNPGRVVVDLAGLNQTAIARAGFDPGAVLERYRPDVVYLPHPHYVSFRRRLFADTAFRRDYRTWSEDTLGSVMGVALRRDSRWFGALAAAFDSVAAAKATRP